MSILGGSVEDHVNRGLRWEMIDPRRLRTQDQSSRIHSEHTDGKGHGGSETAEGNQMKGEEPPYRELFLRL
jgi:hypothetical protein